MGMTFILGAVFISILVAVGTNGDRAEPLRCMSCRKVPHFAHCEGMITCNSSQVCYVEEEIDLGGETVVNAGCREHRDCDSAGCFGEGGTGNVSRTANNAQATTTTNGSRNLVCHHCCDSPYCNMYGCPDTFDVSKLPGSRCFICDNVRHPKDCEVIKNCGSYESCFMELFVFRQEVRYKLGCMRQPMCLKLEETEKLLHRRKRQTQFWSKCCQSHLCNRIDPPAQHSPSPHSQTYRCPSPPPVTKTTTNSGLSTNVTSSAVPMTTTTTQTITIPALPATQRNMPSPQKIECRVVE